MSKRPSLLTVTLAAVFGCKITLCILMHLWSLAVGQGGLSPIVMGGDDGVLYQMQALDIARGQDPGVLTSIYSVLLGQAFKLTGITDLFPYKLVNVIGACLCVVVGIKIFALLRSNSHSETKGISAARQLMILILLLGLYPTELWYTTASLIRDSWIYLFHLLGVYFAMRAIFVRSLPRKIVYWTAFAAAAIALFLFRFYSAMALGAGVVVYIGYVYAAQIKTGRAKRTTLAGFAVFLVLFGIGAAKAISVAVQAESLEHVVNYRAGYQETGGGSNIGIDLASTPSQLVPIVYAYSFVSNTWGPLPWQVNGASTAIAFVLEVPLLAWITLTIFRRRRYLDKGAMFLVCQAVVWFALISISNDNIGTATRLRVLGWHCLFVVYAWVMFQAHVMKVKRRQLVTELDDDTGAPPNES